MTTSRQPDAAAAVGVMCWIQTNVSRYWAEFESGSPPPARFGRGEKIVTTLGVLL